MLGRGLEVSFMLCDFDTLVIVHINRIKDIRFSFGG